jgi:uncharacterized protein (DUF305 family)
MQTKSLIIGLVAGLVIGLLAAPTVFRGGMFNRTNPSQNSQGSQMMANIDRHFIEQMIPHHEGAIEMAKLALEKSKRPEILSLANAIIEAQQREITDMTKWYKDWFGTDVPEGVQHMMGAGMMGGMSHMDSMSGDLDSLKTAKDFDLEFINQMIPHHEMAVMMATMLKGSTNRLEMKELADNIITSQSREIEMMRSWASVWVKK